MANCPACGTQLKDGVKFCPACGTQIPTATVHTNICKNCGNTLKEDAKFCNVCGTPTGIGEAKKVEEKKDEDEKVTMDEVEVPALDAQMAALEKEKPEKSESMPTMDSVEIPGEKPKKKADTAPVEEIPIPSAQPVSSPAQPTAEEIAMANRTVNVPETPVVNDTVSTQTAQQPVYQPQQANVNTAAQPQQTVITPEGQRINQVNNGNVNNPNSIPNYNQMKNVTPGKSTNVIVPIILIILILAVIVFDVFFLFRDKIFGDDNSSAKSNASVVTVDNFNNVENADFITVDL